jgi:hypothetical protein
VRCVRGSRFRFLEAESSASEPDDEDIPFKVAQQALEGEEEDGWTPVSSRKRGSDAEAVADFWCEIGYPTSASRFWERSRQPSPGGSVEVSDAVTSGSPACSPPVGSSRGRSSSSPSGVRLARGPKVGSWRGPLPRRRLTPPPILGDFLDKAEVISGRSVAGSPAVASPSSAVSASSSEAPLAGNGAAVQDTVALIAVSAADHAREICVDRGHSWDSINRYGLGHLARRFQSLWALRRPRVLSSLGLVPGTATQSKTSSPAIAPPQGSSSSTPASPSPGHTLSTPPSPSSSPSPLSSSLSSRPPPRSFASVVMAGQRPPQAGLQGTAARPPVPATPLQQGAPLRPPPSTSAPGGGLQGG